VVALADVRAVCLGIVALDRRRPELAGPCPGDPKPEPLRQLGIRVLMDVDAEYQVVSVHSGNVQEAKEEGDQPRVAINEHHPVDLTVRLVLRALTPVGNGAGDERFPVCELAEPGGRGLDLCDVPG